MKISNHFTFASNLANSSWISRSAPISIVYLEKTPIIRTIPVGTSFSCRIPCTFIFD